ncbi:MAG: sodium:proton antiporter [Clostridia bacterium]|nr:sodium:proton antiporter [Clostridia bacterium]
MELIVFGLFAAGLIACVAADLSILYAMLLGYVLFFGYGIIRKHAFKEMLSFSFSGIKTVKNILITFVFIGMITGVWRACGTIAFIVYHASSLCAPSVMLLVTFLLCCGVSFLTGTAFGSAATIGVICMTMANSMGIPTLLTGGAVLSGVFFGDRCSPMSTSALLVSELTNTSIFKNIVKMVKTSLIPFAVACAVYLVLGFAADASGASADVRGVFAQNYNLHWTAVIPAVIIIAFSLFKINVRITLCVSSVVGFAVACLVQKMGVGDVIRVCISGFKPESTELAALMSGGGILSMVNVMCIICISSCYSGIFRGTGFLDSIQARMQGLSERITPYGTTVITAIVTAMIACNQTLNIMLTHQLCESVYDSDEEMAIALENSAVVISPMIPWSIASAVPLASVGAASASIAFACYLYMIPIYNLAVSLIRKRKSNAR